MWPQYGYDTERSGYNPNSTAFTPGSIGGLHLAWQSPLFVSPSSGDSFFTDTQPLVATNVAGHKALVIVGGEPGDLWAFDGLSGAQVWHTHLGEQRFYYADGTRCGGTMGVGGTPAYDPTSGSIYVEAGNDNSGYPNEVLVYKVAAATGAILGSAVVTPSFLAGEDAEGHTGVTLANGRLYVGTSSGCGDGEAWRGRLAVVDPNSMTLVGTFFTAYSAANPYAGGGVWGWGSASVDPSGNVYVASGNAANGLSYPYADPKTFVRAPAENAGYGEHLVKLTSDVSQVLDSNSPPFNTLFSGDLDYTGSPVLFQPVGCPDELVGTQGKGGLLTVNDTTNLSNATGFQLSEPSGAAYNLGNGAFSPITGLFYASVETSSGGSIAQPGLVAIGNCGTAVQWRSAFGPDSFTYPEFDHPGRSAPTVTAGGVVFLGTPCTPDGSGNCGAAGTIDGAEWAIDASSSAVLGGGKPILMTTGTLRMAATVDGLWAYVIDVAGNLYGLTLDPTVPAIATRRGNYRALPTWHAHRGFSR